MKSMIDNLINGNLKDAKKQAKRFKQADIMQFCIDEYGMSFESAVTGSYKLTDDFIDNMGLVPRTVRDINFTPDDRRLPDLGICRIFTNRRDAEIILTALRQSAAAAALGSIKSDKKAASSRENGKLGGRPKIVDILNKLEKSNTDIIGPSPEAWGYTCCGDDGHGNELYCRGRAFIGKRNGVWIQGLKEWEKSAPHK